MLQPVPLSSESGALVEYDATTTQQQDAFLAGQLSDETKRAYRQDLQQFRAWLAERDKELLEGVTIDDVIAFRTWMHDEQHYAAATIARRLSSLRQFFDHAIVRGLYLTNPAKLVKSYRVSQVSPRVALDNPQARAILSLPDTTKRGIRDRAILYLFLYLGLRRAEVAQLRCNALGAERGHATVRVFGKGDKTRLLPMPPAVAEAVREYLVSEGRADEWGVADVPLFRPLRNRRGDHSLDKTISGTGVWKIVKGYARQAGVSQIDVHTLRHTALTAALDGGASLRRVQALAGHADPKTTARYDSRRQDLDASAAYQVNYG